MTMALPKLNLAPGLLRSVGLGVSRGSCSLGHRIARSAVILLAAGVAFGAETVLPEQHVKSLFLFNFAKYVEWPEESFASTNAPIIIGVLHDKKIGAEISNTVEGRCIAGRNLLVRQIEKDDEIAGCHILYIGAAEKTRQLEILEHVRARPLLTVSENDQFARNGGIIGFIRKDDKIRLEIDLDAARRARLQISSRLLSVADTVNGKR